MHRSSRILAVLGALSLSAVALSAQGQAVAKTDVIPPMSPELIAAINESRNQARSEIDANNEPFRIPDIAVAFQDPLGLIALVEITGVTPPEKDGLTTLEFHVRQILRGESNERKIYADSRWRPGPPSDGPSILYGRETVLDLREPSVGNIYLIGYRLQLDDHKRASIYGAVDLADTEQALIIPDVKRFIGLEADAGDDSLLLFVNALRDPVPWFRDAAAERLDRMDCWISPACSAPLLATTRELLKSENPSERLEGLQWLSRYPVPIDGRKVDPDGQPLFPDSTVRELLASMVTDQNVWIGDLAYPQLAFFDFFRSAPSGECIDIASSLRRSARWTSSEAEHSQIFTPFESASGCIPPQPPAP